MMNPFMNDEPIHEWASVFVKILWVINYTINVDPFVNGSQLVSNNCEYSGATFVQKSMHMEVLKSIWMNEFVHISEGIQACTE